MSKRGRNFAHITVTHTPFFLSCFILIFRRIDQGNHTGSKFRLSLALPVCSVLNCADNSGAKLIYTIGVRNIRGRLNRLPSAGIADSIICSVKKGKANLRRKIWMAVVVRQRKPIRRTDGTVIYFEDNAGVLIKQKGELKGKLVTFSNFTLFRHSHYRPSCKRMCRSLA